MPGGRPRKPTADLKRNKTYKESKHGSRRREPKFDGAPKKPRGLSKAAAKHWDDLVPMLTAKGVTKSVDAPVLELLCLWWDRIQELKAVKEKDYRIDCRLAMATKQWHGLASKLGLTPVDRSRIELKTGEDTTNPFETFLKNRLSNN